MIAYVGMSRFSRPLTRQAPLKLQPSGYEFYGLKLKEMAILKSKTIGMAFLDLDKSSISFFDTV